MLHNPTGMHDTANETSSPDPRCERKDVRSLSFARESPRKIYQGDDWYMPFAMVLPLHSARREARNIINRPSENGYVSVI